MFEKITEAEINERSMANVSTTPNRPTAFGESRMDAQALKLRFDRLSRYLAGRLNEIFAGISDGNLAKSVKIVEEKGEETIEYSLAEFILKMIEGDLTQINVKVPEGTQRLDVICNQVLRWQNEIKTGDFADETVVVEGVTIRQFYEEFKKLEETGQGKPGEPGKSAYDYAVEGGYQGTEEEFAKKLATEYPSKVSQLENDEKYITASGAPVQTVNGKVGNVSLSAADVGARPSTWTPTASEVGARPDDWMPTAEDVGARPDDWMPTASEVGARPATWMPSYSDVGAEKAGNVATHNTNAAAHNDIRLLIAGLSERINAVLDSDDTTLDELSEIVAYIKANKTLIESVTTNKVNVSDIIDNLETPDPTKPLSANQGAVIFSYLDLLAQEFGAALEAKANKEQGVFFIKGEGTTAGTWLGVCFGIESYYDGLMIAYKVGVAGASTTTLNINGLGAVKVVKNNNTGISTSFAVNSVLFLVYTVDGSTAYWKAHDYDSSTRNTVGDYQKNNTKMYFVGSTTTDSETSTSYATSYTNSKVYVDANNVFNAESGFKGNLTGNADTATKATQDGNGNNIPNTYETKANATAKYSELEGKIANAGGGDNVPTYVVTEAERVAKAVQAVRTSKTLVFSAMSDPHLCGEGTAETHINSLISAQSGGAGLREIQKRLNLDFCAILGDYSYTPDNYTAEQTMKDIMLARKTIGISDDKQIWCVGNHDWCYGETADRMLTEDELYAYVGANSDGTKPYANIERCYGYLDFDNQKIRVIFLNTNDCKDGIDNGAITKDNYSYMEMISPTQMRWLADVALDFSDKTNVAEWGVVIISHHPIDYGFNWFKHTLQILEAYREKKSVTLWVADYIKDGNTTGHNETFDFTAVETPADIICNVHGHIHNCASKMVSSQPDSTKTNYVTPWLWRFCVPNMCADRYNEKWNTKWGEVDASGNRVIHEKVMGTAQETSFNIISVDRKNEKIYAHIFGAGIDRVINYKQAYQPKVYSILVSASNCSGASDNPSSIVEAGTATLKFTANSGYVLPDNVTVTGANSTWDKASGTLTLSVPTGNVSVSVAAVVPAPSYTNLLPTSTDTDGSTYNGKGFSTGYLSSGAVTANSSRCVTGFMPIGYGSATTARGEQIIYFEDINVPVGDSYVRIAYYTADKTFIVQQKASDLKATDDGQASSIYTAEAGMIKTVDVTGYTAYLQKTMGKTPAFFRVSVPSATGITDSSIITVNEPIE